MISKKYSIEAFVEAVKGKDSQEVIALAVEEATKADRKVHKNSQAGKDRKASDLFTPAEAADQLSPICSETPFHIKTTYNLYMKYWGHPDQLADTLSPVPPVNTVISPKNGLTLAMNDPGYNGGKKDQQWPLNSISTDTRVRSPTNTGPARYLRCRAKAGQSSGGI
jgi:hypothetical protein